MLADLMRPPDLLKASTRGNDRIVT